jgi:hypothetical protein
MIAEISAGINGLKAAKDMVQALHGVQTAVAINEVKFALQGHLLDAQQGLFAAQEAQSAASKRIAELEKEIVRLKDWEGEKQRYELKDTGQGTLAYALKAGIETGEPAHWLCPSCYQDGKKSILKHEHLATGRVHTLNCHPCGMDILVTGNRFIQNSGIHRGGR